MGTADIHILSTWKKKYFAQAKADEEIWCVYFFNNTNLLWIRKQITKYTILWTYVIFCRSFHILPIKVFFIQIKTVCFWNWFIFNQCSDCCFVFIWYKCIVIIMLITLLFIFLIYLFCLLYTFVSVEYIRM